jgi:tRNA(fMet)-specific endonuclease VapC
MKYLLDTDICIYIIKQHPPSALKRFKSLSLGDLGISSITFAELLYGVEKSQQQQKNLTALEEFTLPLEILPFDDRAAQQYSVIRAQLEKKGLPIGPLDLMIAAHALSLDAIIVTNNLKEFSRIPTLKIENWV